MRKHRLPASQALHPIQCPLPNLYAAQLCSRRPPRAIDGTRPRPHGFNWRLPSCATEPKHHVGRGRGGDEEQRLALQRNGVPRSSRHLGAVDLLLDDVSLRAEIWRLYGYWDGELGTAANSYYLQVDTGNDIL
ncbi:hypothetical protein ACP70R_048202 [Stipagrostis hirtigluma subsp. patula]